MTRPSEQIPPWDGYSRFFGRWIFPLLDRLNGTTLASKLDSLLESEHLDRNEIERRQEREVERTVARTRRASAFYRHLWEYRTGEGPASRFPALDRLPVVTKADFAAAPDAFPLPGHQGKIISCRTSGSTGSPMVFHRSMEQESWFWALRLRMWRWSGYHPGDPYLAINLNPRLGFKKKLQDKLFRCTYLTFNADNQDSERIARALIRDRIPHINAFASSLLVLARYMLDRGLEPPGMVGITSTGDTLDPEYRRIIEKALGTRVTDYYGAGGEGFHVASQCAESGSRYHIHPENALLEILGKDGPAEAGELGRIVVTQFHNEAMPLVRYELGDVGAAAPDDARCTCGRTLPMLEKIEGRVPDLIAVADGTFLVMHFFVVLFKNLQEIHRYQIVQDEVAGIRVRLVPRGEGNRQPIEATVRREIDRATRGQLAVDFEWVDEIPLTGRGKRRLIISNVSRDRLLAG